MPDQLPVLETARLILRPFTLADARRVQELAGDPDVANPTLNIPHPYPDGAAEEWISSHAEAFRHGRQLNLAITLRDEQTLIGAIGLSSISQAHARAELGYWIGKPYWNRGYATEACRAMVGYGFGRLGLNRVHANHLPWNPPSGRVMAKLGMKYEGLLRQHVRNRGQFEDLLLYAILCSEFNPRGT